MDERDESNSASRTEETEAVDGERIVKTVVLDAPIERVWRAITDHVEFGKWFRVVIDQPFEVGRTQTGRITEPGAEHYKWLSTVVEMQAPRRFAYRWPHPKDPHAESYEGEPMTLVTFDLEPVPEGTRLTITESGFEVVDEQRRAASIRDNTQGWEIQSQRIARYLAG